MQSSSPQLPLNELSSLLADPAEKSLKKDELQSGSASQHERCTQAVDPRSPLFYLTILVWVCSLGFGFFALFQYILPALVHKNWSRWDKTNPGLYRPGIPSANDLMVTHQIWGFFLMIAGPVQLIPSIRRRFLRMHRWIGRIYIVASLMASGCAIIFVLLYRTSRRWIHEDIGNILFGLAAFGAAIQSYRYIAVSKDIEMHKLWSWRLFAVIFGAAFYRVEQVPYAILLIVFHGPWSYSKVYMNISFYLIWAPGWLLIELLRLYNWKPSSSILWVAFGLLAFMTLVIYTVDWIPAVLDMPSSIQGDLLDVGNST